MKFTGNLKDWWEPVTKTQFVDKTKCIINQYGNYTAKQVGLNLNGITTQGENIADNGGTKEAYMALGKLQIPKRNWVTTQLHNLHYIVPGL